MTYIDFTIASLGPWAPLAGGLSLDGVLGLASYLGAGFALAASFLAGQPAWTPATSGNGRRDRRGAPRVALQAVKSDSGSARVAPPRERLLGLLVKDNILTPSQASRVAEEHLATNESLPTVLRRLGLLGDSQLLDFLSHTYTMPVINLERVTVPDDITRLVKQDILEKHQVFPVRRIGSTLTLAIADPTAVLAIDDVQFATGLHVVTVLASESAIRAAIEKHYSIGAARLNEILMAEQKTNGDTVEVIERPQAADITEVGGQTNDAPVVRIVNFILAEAIRQRASDIHLEPFERTFRVRYRIDGVLHDIIAPPKPLEPAILSRVKIMANLDIAERRLPQDGRISVKAGSKEVDLRVSSLPTKFGEKIVMRILDRSSVVLDLAQLGFEEDDRARFTRAIQEPYGMILVTGPTGSGKSTTLYAAVSAINSPGINIMTAEDPIEYNLDGVNQVHVRDDIGLSFSAALRSFLRQDPDVILVGEMRDTETAGIAVRAALTGHLVFSTLHTNDAPSTVTRLLDMGIEPFLVSSTVLMVVAQRLCRRICVDCREPIEVPLSTLLDVGFEPEEAETLPIYRGMGCHKCAHTGYWGRTAVHEILAIDPEIQEAIVTQRPASEIRQIAVKRGMRTIRQVGLRKVAQGITTIDEIVRVTHAD